MADQAHEPVMDGLMQPRPLTIAHILERAERLYAHKPVVVAGTERLTYADVARNTRRLATALDRLHVPVGARVATFASKSSTCALRIRSTGRSASGTRQLRESSAARIVFGRGRTRPAAPIANRSNQACATSPNRSGAAW